VSDESQLGRGAALIDALLADPERPQRFGALQRALRGLNAASLSRLLKLMQSEGLVVAVEGGYAIGARARGWGRRLRPAGCGLLDALDAAMRRISDAHRATTILIERRGELVESVHKVLHEDAPALMPVGRRFPPRLPYFGCIVFLEPPRRQLEDWIGTQLVDVAPQVAQRRAQAVTVVRRYQRTGVYHDRELWPGQVRMAVPVRRGADVVAMLGAAITAGSREREAEAGLLAALQAAVAS